jgi:hypothetical protein
VKAEQPTEPSTQQGATTSGVGAGGGFQGSPLDDPASLLSNRTVYFAYDSSEITGPDRPVIEAHGRYLADNPSASVTLEGHADERGSREYNLALGERRANAVRQLMSLLGASGSQIRTAQPACGDHLPQPLKALTRARAPRWRPCRSAFREPETCRCSASIATRRQVQWRGTPPHGFVLVP